MTQFFVRAFSTALVSLLATAAGADSFASSASSAGSKLVGSLSDSFTGSSNSSSGDRKVAAGHYRIEQMAEVADKPGHVRLHLQATATKGAAGAVLLDLPRQAVQGQGLQARALIELRQRPYGMEVAHQKTAAAPPAAFFLLLADGWRNDLDTRAVRL